METLLTRKEVAQALRVSEKTVQKLQKDGKLPNVAADVCRGAKYRESDLKKLLK